MVSKAAATAGDNFSEDSESSFYMESDLDC